MAARRPASLKKRLPRSRTGRIIVGAVLVACGFAGFLPVVGFWMIPLGIAVLSIDVPAVRRFRRSAKVKLGRWWQKHKTCG